MTEVWMEDSNSLADSQNSESGNSLSDAVEGFTQFLNSGETPEWMREIINGYELQKPLSHEDQKALCALYQPGATLRQYLIKHNRNPRQVELNILNNAEQAIDTLVQTNMLAIMSIAKKYLGRGQPFEDLIHVGTIGLIRGMFSYNPEKSDKPINYAWWWIRKELDLYVNKEKSSARIGYHLNLLYMRARRTVLKYKNSHHGDEPEIEQLLELLNEERDPYTGLKRRPVKLKRLQNALEIHTFDISTSTDLEVPGDAESEETTPSGFDVDDATEINSVKQCLSDAFNTLANKNIRRALAVRLKHLFDYGLLTEVLKYDISTLELQESETMSADILRLWQLWYTMDYVEENDNRINNGNFSIKIGENKFELQSEVISQFVKHFGIGWTRQAVDEHIRFGIPELKKILLSMQKIPYTVQEYLEVYLQSIESNDQE